MEGHNVFVCHSLRRASEVKPGKAAQRERLLQELADEDTSLINERLLPPHSASSLLH